MRKIVLGKKVRFALLVLIASVMGIQASEAYKLYCPDPRPPAPPFTQVVQHAGDYRISSFTHGGTPIEVFDTRSTQIVNLLEAKLNYAKLGSTSRGEKILFCHYIAVNGDEFILEAMKDEFQRCNDVPNATYIECF